MLIEEDRYGHILKHKTGIEVAIIVTDLKLNDEHIGHRLHVCVANGDIKAAPIVANLPRMSDESLDSIINELINEVTNIDIELLMQPEDGMGEADEGP